MTRHDGHPTTTRSRAPARVTISVPGPLRGLAGGEGEVAVEASTVREAVDRLLERHPGLRRHVRTEGGALREHVNLFLNEDDIRYVDGEDSPVGAGDTVTIIPSIAGG